MKKIQSDGERHVERKRVWEILKRQRHREKGERESERKEKRGKERNREGPD